MDHAPCSATCTDESCTNESTQTHALACRLGNWVMMSSMPCSLQQLASSQTSSRGSSSTWYRALSRPCKESSTRVSPLTGGRRAWPVTGVSNIRSASSAATLRSFDAWPCAHNIPLSVTSSADSDPPDTDLSSRNE
eukprot:355658-Chlamydomonas_euryale.AAC.10